MTYKNNVSVRICGKTMVLSGNETVEYITKVANYIEEKAEELRRSDNSKSLNPNLISVLTSINIADDYFKEQGKVEKLEKELDKLKSTSTGTSEIQVMGDFTEEEKLAFEAEIARLTKELEASLAVNSEASEALLEITTQRDTLLLEKEEFTQKISTLEENLRKQIAKLNHIKSNEYKLNKQGYTPQKNNPQGSDEINETIKGKSEETSVQEQAPKQETAQKEIGAPGEKIEIQEAIMTEPHKPSSPMIKNYYRNT